MMSIVLAWLVFGFGVAGAGYILAGGLKNSLAAMAKGMTLTGMGMMAAGVYCYLERPNTIVVDRMDQLALDTPLTLAAIGFLCVALGFVCKAPRASHKK